MINHEGPRRATKRMGAWRRICGHAATAVAWGLVLLALGVAGLWVDSLENAAYIDYSWVSGRNATVQGIGVSSGRQVFVVHYASAADSHRFSSAFGIGWTMGLVDQRQWFRRAIFTIFGQRGELWSWFDYDRRVFSQTAGDKLDGISYRLMFPHWFVLLLLLPWPARRGWGWMKLRRRRRKGLCLNCGYDLRASPELCPECGLKKPD